VRVREASVIARSVGSRELFEYFIGVRCCISRCRDDAGCDACSTDRENCGSEKSRHSPATAFGGQPGAHRGARIVRMSLPLRHVYIALGTMMVAPCATVIPS
jgi:hypothetical protein